MGTELFIGRIYPENFCRCAKRHSFDQHYLASRAIFLTHFYTGKSSNCSVAAFFCIPADRLTKSGMYCLYTDPALKGVIEITCGVIGITAEAE